MYPGYWELSTSAGWSAGNSSSEIDDELVMILTVLCQLGRPLSENGLSTSFFNYRCKNISSWAAKNCVVCRVLVCTGAWMARTMMLSKEGWEGCLDPHQLLTGAKRREFSGMIHVITSNVIIPATPSNPQQPIHSLRLARTSKTFIPTSSRSCDFRYSLTVTNFDEAMDALRSSTRTWGLTGFMVLLEKKQEPEDWSIDWLNIGWAE